MKNQYEVTITEQFLANNFKNFACVTEGFVVDITTDPEAPEAVVTVIESPSRRAVYEYLSEQGYSVSMVMFSKLEFEENVTLIQKLSGDGLEAPVYFAQLKVKDMIEATLAPATLAQIINPASCERPFVSVFNGELTLG